MSTRSPSGTFSTVTGSTLLATGVLSPVESGLFDLQGRRDEDPAVGGDLVAGFETDDVTWHQFLSWYLDQLPVAADVRPS